MIEAVRSILGKELSSGMEPGGIDVQTTPFADHKELAARVAAFQPQEGWDQLYRRDRSPADGSPAVDPRRFIIAGELFSKGKSLHIRQSGQGWMAVEMTRTAAPDKIIVRESFCNRKEAPGRLMYETCWQMTASPTGGPLAYAPVVSRFVGFDRVGGRE